MPPFLNIPLYLDITAKLIPGFITLVLGSLGTWIAYNQYRTNRDKLRLDLFEKRLEAYEQLQRYFSCLEHDGHVGHKAILILNQARYKSLFLFGDDINKHIEEVAEKGREMLKIHQKLYGAKALPVGEYRSEICDKEAELMEWNIDRQENSYKLYAKYLKFL